MMKWIGAALALLFCAPAFADQAPETPLVTGPNMQQTPASQILIKVPGSTIQTLGAALSASGCTTNCTLSNPTITGGSFSGGAVAATTLSATGTGNNTVGSAITYDYSQSGADTRYVYYNNILSPSINTTNIWENHNSFVTLNGPGQANGEINVEHAYMQINLGASLGGGEDYEASAQVVGTVGGFDGFLATLANASTGTVTNSLNGFYAQLTNNNTTVGSINTWAAFRCLGMGGSGSQPTSSYCLLNSDANQRISSAGPARFGSVNNGQGALGATGPDISAFTANTGWYNGAGVYNAMVTDQGAIGAGFSNLASAWAMLMIGDQGGTSTYGTHIQVMQTAAPGITGGTLDSQASDVAGTITLTAANPVLTFRVAYHSTPHAVVSSPSGTAFTYSVSASAIAFTGGASGNTVTYMVMQ